MTNGEIGFSELVSSARALGNGSAADAVVTQCGIQPGDILQLVQLSDWPSVMSAHALIEAALDGALETNFADRRRPSFNKRVDKARKRNLITREQASQVKLIAQIRNRFAAHKPNAPLRFRLDEVLKDRKLRGCFLKYFKLEAEDLATAREAIWVVALLVLGGLLVTVQVPREHRRPMA
jgi:hypothetical protein